MTRLLRLGALVFLLMQGAEADEIDDFVRQTMARDQIPGLVLAIVSPKGEAVRPYGFANLEHNVPVQAVTVFQSGSTGKQFTAAAILLLVDERKLKLDDSIAQYLPSDRPAWRAITIRHLLTHTSGLGDYESGVAGGLDMRRDYSEQELVEWAMRLEPEFAPGTRWAYSNTGYVVLGALVRKVSGRFYGDLLRDRIFTPAQMRTARVITEAELVPNRAAGYELVDGQLRNQSWVAPSLNTTADGSLYLSALDWLGWEAALRAHRLLSADSYRAMWTPVHLANGQTYPYGFGWFLHEQRGSPLIEHPGTWQGFQAHIARYVERELTVVALCNHSRCNPTRISHRVAGLIDPALALPDPAAPGPDPLPQRTATLQPAFEAWVDGRAHPSMALGFAASPDTSPRAKAMRGAVREWMEGAQFRCVAEDDVRKRNIERYGERAASIVYCGLARADEALGIKLYVNAAGAPMGIYVEGW